MELTPLKRAIMFGAPLSYFLIGVVHPIEFKVGDAAGLYLGIHVVQLLSIWGMALMLTFLIEGIDNRAARIARAAILPYVIVYAAFDAIAGIAFGMIVMEANTMSAVDQDTIQRMLDGDKLFPVTLALFLGSGLSWLFASGTAIFSLKGKRPAGALALLFLGAVVFAVAHPFPPGPIGMTLFIAGLAWLQLDARAATRRTGEQTLVLQARGV
jgi:hypothetical protein